jgi:type IX secretion system PorP/SprF family membrane protein
MKPFTYILFFLTLGISTFAQQDAMFTRYTFVSNMLYNPASTGRSQGILTSLAYRSQWAKVEGAPTTIAIAAESSLNDGRAGLGLNMFRDEIGFDQHTGIHVNYAYRIQLNNKFILSLGIKGGASIISSDFTNVITPNPGLNDPIYNGNPQVFVPKAGFGAFLHDDRSYIGISVPTVFSAIPRDRFTYQDDASFLSHHYFLTAGYVFDISNTDLQLKPSAFLKYHPAAPLQLDFNAQVWYKDVFSFGLSYRTGDAISGILEMALTKDVVLSYAYDYTFSDFRVIADGAHEFIMLYTWRKKDVKIPSIHKFSTLSRF